MPAACGCSLSFGGCLLGIPAFQLCQGVPDTAAGLDLGGTIAAVTPAGRGKRYLAVWRDESAREHTEAYSTKADADAR
jgi:hypothetical protein